MTAVRYGWLLNDFNLLHEFSIFGGYVKSYFLMLI